MLPDNANPTPPSVWARYGLALGAVAIAIAVRTVVTPQMGPTNLPFITFFPAVAVVAWFGRLKPAIVSLVLSAFAADWFFMEPVHSLSALSGTSVLALITFVFSSGIIVAAIETMHAARSRLAREAALRQRDQSALAVTLSSIGDGVIATDAIGCITFINPEASRLTGWTEGEAKGRRLPEVFHIISERTRKPTESPVEKVLRSGRVVGLANHTLLVAKDGSETAIDDSAASIRQADGSVSGVVLVFRDATKERKALAAKARLAAIVENSGDVMITKDLNGIIQTWNASAQRLFGYTEDEIVGKSVTMLIPPERLQEENFILDRLRNGQIVERLETKRVAKDGRQIPVALSVSPIRSDDGEFIGASKIIHDISDLVAAREALVREKELLATTLACIGDGVAVTDAQGNVTFLNAEAERLTGWKNPAAVGRPLPEVFHIVNEETRLEVENPVTKVLRVGGVVGLANHTVLIRPDGTETPIDDSAAPICEPGKPLFGVVLVFRDATPERKAHAILREREAELAAIINRTPFLLTRCTRDLRFRFVSRAYAEMRNLSLENIAGKRIEECVPENELKAVLPHMENVLRGNREEFECQVDLQKSNGPRHLHCIYTPETDDAGQVVGWVGSIVDITERKRTEHALNEAHEQLRSRAVHLESLVQQRTARLNEIVGDLEAFSYSIVHDMRAPLRAMQGFAQLLVEECGPISAKASDYVRRISNGAQRMDRLIQDGLSYSRMMRADLPLTPIDVAALIRGIVDTYPTFQTPAAVIELEGEFPPVIGNEAALTPCVSNLLDNAVKFVAPGVTPHVRIWADVRDGHVRVYFKDNGIGIAPQAHAKIFEIFHRLQPAFEGTGIGLAIVKKAAERMGGTTGLQSALGEGSTFWIELPKANGN
ncbi:MAG TPA: PAS domain S-box protein [Opitutaceae bacterium]|nr:PAS domain S-box protein [Opitutaceae bacterium]